MERTTELHDRIFAAADALYEQGACTDFPTVDAVRKMARVNMNDASTAMRVWRRAHTSHPAHDLIAVPEPVQQAGNAAIATVWKAAQEFAATALRDAQAQWDVERAEADTVHRQIADAFELQSTELAAALARLSQYDDDGIRWARDKLTLEATVDELRGALTAATASREHAEARTIEIERRANELRTELDHAHRDMLASRTAMSEERSTHAKELERMQADLAALQAHAATELARMQQEVTTAREDAAALRGQLVTLKEHNAALSQAEWSVPKTDHR